MSYNIFIEKEPGYNCEHQTYSNPKQSCFWIDMSVVPSISKTSLDITIHLRQLSIAMGWFTISFITLSKKNEWH